MEALTLSVHALMWSLLALPSSRAGPLIDGLWSLLALKGSSSRQNGVDVESTRTSGCQGMAHGWESARSEARQLPVGWQKVPAQIVPLLVLKQTSVWPVDP